MPGGLLALVLLGSPPFAHAPALTGVPGLCSTLYALEIEAAVGDVSSVWKVPPSLVKAIIHRESAFNPTALSRAGAVGLMQVLPRNAERLGVRSEELWVPRLNILAGTRLLAVLLRHYQGDVISALVAYNGRPRQVFAAPPKNGETALYVRAVLEAWRRCLPSAVIETSNVLQVPHPTARPELVESDQATDLELLDVRLRRTLTAASAVGTLANRLSRTGHGTPPSRAGRESPHFIVVSTALRSAPAPPSSGFPRAAGVDERRPLARTPCRCRSNSAKALLDGVGGP
jgi:hypothetical protein